MNHYEIKGNLFSDDILAALPEKRGQSERDFGLPSNVRLADEISRTFTLAKSHWSGFEPYRNELNTWDSAVKITRAKWMVPFINSLGYELQFVRKGEELDGKKYVISHHHLDPKGFPVHIVGFNESLDQNPDKSRGRRQSPHVLMQEFLNHNEAHLYGIVTNGRKLRLLRNHHRLTGMQYMEWDLKAIMESGDLPAFGLLYRLLHRTRMEGAENAFIDAYHHESVEDGNRVRANLQQSVKSCLEELGEGFLQHHANQALRHALETNELSTIQYGVHLRKLVYRLLFLLVVEDRKVVFDPDATNRHRHIYSSYYSLKRLRQLAANHFRVSGRYGDLWEQLKDNFAFFERPDVGRPLGISPLGGQLFDPGSLGPLTSAKLDNATLLRAMDHLCRFTKKEGGRTNINYARINVEEFGAVYESLLSLNPEIDLAGPIPTFRYVEGGMRKSTGSYYTHDDLVKQLLKTTLTPVVEERIAQAAKSATSRDEVAEAQAKAILELKVCDPACGSGHFLLGAARALAHALAHIRAGSGNSIEGHYQPALRQVIERCIYGVDLNPDAVELCRMVLSLEAHEPEKPILFLGAKIKCGNSLLGWPKEIVPPMVPDGAFEATDYDDAVTASSVKQRNRVERQGQKSMSLLNADFSKHQLEYANDLNKIDSIPTNTLSQVWQKQRAYESIEQSAYIQKNRLLYDAWTFAFLQPLTEINRGKFITQSTLEGIRSGEITSSNTIVLELQRTARNLGFFHWQIEFVDVFSGKNGSRGFDVIVANPPWEGLKFSEREFFFERDREIALETNSSKRKEKISELKEQNPGLWDAFISAKRSLQATRGFFKNCGRYPLTSSGALNLYPLFSELILQLLKDSNRAGVLVPTGIAMDFSNRHFFQEITRNKRLRRLIDFDNRKKFFPEVSDGQKFSIINLGGPNESFPTPLFSFFSDLSLGTKTSNPQYTLLPEELNFFNPNTSTSPAFRTTKDLEISKRIYNRFPIILTNDDKENPWDISFFQMFNMSSHSKWFRTAKQLNLPPKSSSNRFWIDQNKNSWVRLFEAKMIWHYNHRFAGFKSKKSRKGGADQLMESDLTQCTLSASPWYWIEENQVEKKCNQRFLANDKDSNDWPIGFRDTASVSNDRTFVCSIIPKCGTSNKLPLIITKKNAVRKCILLGQLSSLVFDYNTRQKIGLSTLNLFYIKQLPIVPPSKFSDLDFQFVVPRVLELTYTAWDIKGFADHVWRDADESLRDLITQRWAYNQAITPLPPELDEAFEQPDWVEDREDGCPLPPFRWNPEYRHRLQSELDAYFAMKYELNYDELLYILDPHHEDSMGPDFPGETFRVLKNKEKTKYGEFRTRKLVLEAWENKPWETPTHLEAVPITAALARRSRKPSALLLQTMAYIIDRHDPPRFRHTLRRTKMEKLLHLIEAEMELDLGREPIKDQFGPADNALREAACREADNRHYFHEIEEPITHPGAQSRVQYSYQKGENLFELLTAFREAQADHLEQINQLLAPFLELKSTQVEIRVTLYAAWNNLLLANTPILSDEAIIRAAREEWHEQKERYAIRDFEFGLAWLRQQGIVPTGRGKTVTNNLG